MKIESKHIAPLLLCLLILSCNGEKNKATYACLLQWDAMLDEQPQAVSDSLLPLNPKNLSHANRAYYGLLKTIADDKTYARFTSDSLINSVEQYYKRHNKGSNNHIRSLIYQSIVRTRMGVTDTTVLMPLKEAEPLFKRQKQQNPSIGYLMNYYLGEILEVKNDVTKSNIYFKQALYFAQKEGNFRHCFDAYMALYWSEMLQRNNVTGKLYLDTLNTFTDLSTEANYYLLNAKSVYYDSQQEYQKALQVEKQQVELLDDMPVQIDKFRMYYSISGRYNTLNQLDSAMYYARLAVENIADSTYKLNYVLYAIPR